MRVGQILDLILLFAAGRLLLPQLRRFLAAHDRLEPNYLGTLIPCGMGGLLWLLLWMQELLLQGAAFFLSSRGGETGQPLLELALQGEKASRAFLLAATIIFFAGWTDDWIGHRNVKGLRGHWRYWRDTRTISTGGLKALATASACLWVLAATTQTNSPIWIMGLKLILMAMMTNTWNLLDVRPGRSLKAFVGVLLLFVLTGCAGRGSLLLALPVMVGALLLFPSDNRGEAMLGDGGANLLGFTCGYVFVTEAPAGLQAVMLALLCVIHHKAETSSITRHIERNRILNWLDRLGRT